jgi:hypothetical protein
MGPSYSTRQDSYIIIISFLKIIKKTEKEREIVCGDSPLLFCSLNIDNDFFLRWLGI